MGHEKSLLEKMFLNSVLCDQFCEYLPFKDMKTLREVSPLLDNGIQNNTLFKKRCVLVIEKETDLKAIQQSAVAWKNVHLKLHSTIFTDLYPYKEYLSQLFENSVGYIHLDLDLTSCTWNFKIEIPRFFDNCSSVFNPAKLKEIRIHSFLLSTNLTSSVILKDFSVKILKNLKVITAYSRKRDMVTYLARDHQQNAAGGRLMRPCALVENFLLIRDHCTSLSGLNMFNTILFSPNNEFAEHVLATLKTNINTITTINLEEAAFFSEFSPVKGLLSEIRLNSLKNVGILSCDDHETLARFLENQPPLHSLLLELRERLPFKLLQIIKAKSSKLRNLCIKVDSTEMYGLEEGVNRRMSDLALSQWTFLQTLEHLQKLSFIQMDDSTRRNNQIVHSTTVNRILGNLPKNIKHIQLEGLTTEQGVQVNFSSLPFEQLTTLSLLRCHDSLDDTKLQLILHRLTKLQMFEISHCAQLTNFGLTGISPPNSELTSSEVSIKNIKGLKSLTLRKCPAITMQILPFLTFKFLNEITLGNNDRFPSSIEMMSGLVIQNPMLEKINLTKDGLITGQEIDAVRLAETTGRRQECRVTFLETDWLYEDEEENAGLMIVHLQRP